MAITRLAAQDIQNASAAASVSAVYPSTPTQGNVLIAVLYHNVSTLNLATITGWTLFKQVVAGSSVGNGVISIFVKVAGAGESTTVTANSTGATVMRIQIYEYNGVSLNADGTSAVGGGATSVTSRAAASAGALATTNADDLLIAAWGFTASTSAWSVDSGFTLLQTDARVAAAQRITSATGTYNPTLSWTTAVRSGGIIIGLKAALPGQGTATGNVAYAGSATGTRTPKATAMGNVDYVGSAVGARTPKGSTTGALAYTGSASGTRAPKASASGNVAYSGSAVGTRFPRAVAGGLLEWSGTAVGTTARSGTASGLLEWAGSAVGEQTAATPSTRTLVAWAEDRSVSVGAESRSVRVPTGTRTRPVSRNHVG